MKIVETPTEAYAHTDHWRREGLRIGLIPTMGALHAGHLSLAERSRQECDITVVTIFVNPTQFGPQEDFGRYPRTLQEDLLQLKQLGVDMVFTPPRERMYPEGFSSSVQPPAIAEPLEGVRRPGHYQGVVTIVLKLFQIVPATIAYFGQKDYQQLAVIRHMANDLNVPIRIEGCETVREPDGLAMSSRNRYLSPEKRHAALGLWKALSHVKAEAANGQTAIATLEKQMETILYDAGVDRIDYARIVDRDSLADLTLLDRPAVALIAAHVGPTRLIDNLVLDD
ncbi:pantoate--beta-alanine ligase [Aureliella helgolandensis]|uniref:Pantothenate synthetase n=1 Tax=Aureliella helgolandensis TaxID=2527968 RepID=A0A518G084_9BACT|nr:pantoate--beta-alanine ligase [Aureliella helgolandensis]QDV22018.1 Pantoate-beta-alanine ligase [Aureliella helgolandensis]